MLRSRKEFVEIYKKLESLSETYNKKVLFVIFKNKQILKEILDEIIKKETEIVTEEYAKMEKERQNILLIHCERDSEGRPVIQNEQVLIKQESVTAFNDSVSKLFKDNEEVINQYNENRKEFNTYINETIELEFGKYSFNDLPEDMSVEMYSLMSLFIKESEEELSKLV